MELPKGHKRRVKERLKSYVRDTAALDLIDTLLNLDPNHRLDADKALNHAFFWTDPMPQPLHRMLSQHTTSMFEFLAPPRRPGGKGGPPAQPKNEGQYQDRVF